MLVLLHHSVCSTLIQVPIFMTEEQWKLSHKYKMDIKVHCSMMV